MVVKESEVVGDATLTADGEVVVVVVDGTVTVGGNGAITLSLLKGLPLENDPLFIADLPKTVLFHSRICMSFAISEKLACAPLHRRKYLRSSSVHTIFIEICHVK